MGAGPNGSPGINKMCRVISQRAEKVAGKAERDLVLDIGTIQADLGLLLNTFPKTIPKGEYHICRHVNGFKFRTENSSLSHEHWVKPPKIKKGDRVLAAWVQNEVVVIDVIDATE